MQVSVAYGMKGLTVEIPDNVDATIVEPINLPGLPDPDQVVVAALTSPIDSPSLQALAAKAKTVGIVFSDITRPVPNRILIPCLLQALDTIPLEQIVLFNALGSHRENSRRELIELLGKEIVGNVRIVQNQAFNPETQIYLGRTRVGYEVWINRAFFETDLKILTGLIEPHMFAGFSGGPKSVLPGMAGQSTILNNHCVRNIGDPKATWGITSGNPIWEEMQEIVSELDSTFLLNVALNKKKQITGVFAGDIQSAHQVGCEFVKQTAMVAVEKPFDIVVTTNSGYPLDQNLYQSVKGISAASQIVRPGGTILLVAECRDGIPKHGLYATLLKETSGPEEMLERIHAPGFQAQDQWQLEIQAQILLNTDVFVYSDYLSDQEILDAHFQPCRDIEHTIERLIQRDGPQQTLCVLPDGPQTIPYVREAVT